MFSQAAVAHVECVFQGCVLAPSCLCCSLLVPVPRVLCLSLHERGWSRSRGPSCACVALWWLLAQAGAA